MWLHFAFLHFPYKSNAAPLTDGPVPGSGSLNLDSTGLNDQVMGSAMLSVAAFQEEQ